jgi:hypothetical protein
VTAPDPTQLTVYAIVHAQKTCSYFELKDRAYLAGIRTDVFPAKEALRKQKRIDNITITVPSTIPRKVTFVFCRDCPPEAIRPVYQEKKNLLLRHYNHCKEIGTHAEQLVKRTCQDLLYTELELNKKSHNGIGIGDREIDVFGKHPGNEYYQAISVKNRREPVGIEDMNDAINTALVASQAWHMDIRPALVATYASRFKLNDAKSMGLAMTAWGKQIIPDRFHEEYETLLVPGLALNVQITDNPPPEMTRRVAEYIMRFQQAA